jgi:hypothetical protein
MKLLYKTAELHGFAKLRIHTDSTLQWLETLTKEFGQLMRDFRAQSCSEFQTVELPREAAARHRQQQPEHAEAKSSSTRCQPGVNISTGIQTEGSHSLPAPPAAQSLISASRKVKKLNLFTLKFHFLGDYVQTIRLFGGTDSYSTQLVRRSYLGSEPHANKYL